MCLTLNLFWKWAVQRVWVQNWKKGIHSQPQNTMQRYYKLWFPCLYKAMLHYTSGRSSYEYEYWVNIVHKCMRIWIMMRSFNFHHINWEINNSWWCRFFKIKKGRGLCYRHCLQQLGRKWSWLSLITCLMMIYPSFTVFPEENRKVYLYPSNDYGLRKARS